VRGVGHPTPVPRRIVMLTSKPAKPTPDFPLFPHGNGQWAKKIKGKLCYFGPWQNPAKALEQFQTSQDANQSSETQSDLEGPKPKKPHADFPLFPHKGTGRWAKKVRGKTLYFGKLADDPKGETAL